VPDDLLTHPDKVELRFMDEFVAPVREWCRTHADRLNSCWITTDGQGPVVFVTGKEAGYDYSLGDPLAALEVDLYRRGWRCSVLQLPADPPSWRSFVREDEAIQVFPEAAQTSHADR
jgi:hypothetical protein